MEQFSYEPVATVENTERQLKIQRCSRFSWKPFLRQLFVCSGTMLSYFVGGLYFGAPTVTIPQLRTEANSTKVVSDGMASWLSSVHGYSSLPWVFILPILSEFTGRKIPFAVTCTVVLIGYLLFYFSTTALQILISEIIIGIIFACNMVCSVVIVAEFTSAHYRGIFLTMKSAMFHWGVLSANIIGTFFHWRNIVLVAIIGTIYSMTVFLWPESPFWLATKGRFDECVASHHWLKGYGNDAENELEKLINSQKEYIRNNSRRKRCRLFDLSVIISSKTFYKPILLALVMQTMYHFNGKLTCSMYAVQIIKKITNDNSTAYIGMIILDGVSLFCMYFGCFISNYLKRRTLLFLTTATAILFLFVMSTYLYLIKLSYLIENNIVSIALLASFTIAICCGPMILSTSIYAELIPLRFKNTSVLLITLINNIMLASNLKFAPFVIKCCGLHGLFLIYGVISLIATLVLYKFLPETKDKTLQEIETFFDN